MSGLCSAHKHYEKGCIQCEARHDVSASGSNELLCVSVPVVELEKLEQARVNLYKFLEKKLTQQEHYNLVNMTGQIWRVANTKKWD